MRFPGGPNSLQMTCRFCMSLGFTLVAILFSSILSNNGNFVFRHFETLFEEKDAAKRRINSINFSETDWSIGKLRLISLLGSYNAG